MCSLNDFFYCEIQFLRNNCPLSITWKRIYQVNQQAINESIICSKFKFTVNSLHSLSGSTLLSLVRAKKTRLITSAARCHVKCDLCWVTIWPFIIHQSWEPVAHQWAEATTSQKVGVLATTRTRSLTRTVLSAKRGYAISNPDHRTAAVQCQVGSITAMCF